MPTIAEQISKNSTTPSSNIATALEGYNGGGSGSGGGVFVVNMVENESGTEIRLSKTAEEIIEAINEGLFPVLFRKWINSERDNAEETDVYYLYNAQPRTETGYPYCFYFLAITGDSTLQLSIMYCTAENGNDYPLWDPVS